MLHLIYMRHAYIHVSGKLAIMLAICSILVQIQNASAAGVCMQMHCKSAINVIHQAAEHVASSCTACEDLILSS